MPRASPTRAALSSRRVSNPCPMRSPARSLARAGEGGSWREVEGGGGRGGRELERGGWLGRGCCGSSEVVRRMGLVPGPRPELGRRPTAFSQRGREIARSSEWSRVALPHAFRAAHSARPFSGPIQMQSGGISRSGPQARTQSSHHLARAPSASRRGAGSGLPRRSPASPAPESRRLFPG